jgi:type II secretory pathway pseudopilin PulG
MRIKNLNNSAFSLLEILLAAIIFLASVAGVFATLNAVRGPVANKENALAAAVFGKQALEALFSQVENPTYYNSCTDFNGGDGTCSDFSLAVGTHEVTTLGAGWPAGLAWPAILSASNTCPNVAPPVASGCLSYIVACADGSAGPSCGGNPNIAHRVDLNVNWPSVP